MMRKTIVKNPLVDQIDAMLIEIKAAENTIALAELLIEAEMKAVSQKFSYLVELRADLVSKSESFKKFVNKHRDEIFGKPQKLNLEHGWINWASTKKLHLPKNDVVVANIKAAGFEDGIRVIEEPDRTVIEKWPLEKIEAIGGKKKPHNEIKWGTK